jgi:hypothetical protein
MFRKESKMRGLVLLVLLAGDLATAKASASWVEAPTTRSLPGQEAVRAKTYFEDSFGRKKGKFKAMYESFLEDKDFVEGEFLVARFRYVYFDAFIKPLPWLSVVPPEGKADRCKCGLGFSALALLVQRKPSFLALEALNPSNGGPARSGWAVSGSSVSSRTRRHGRQCRRSGRAGFGRTRRPPWSSWSWRTIGR